MWNPFKKLPHTREAYEEVEKELNEVGEEILKTIRGRTKRKKGDLIKVLDKFHFKKTEKEELGRRGHEEAIIMENKYQKLLEELEDARKAGENVSEKEDALRNFEEKELGMKVDRSGHHQGPYR